MARTPEKIEILKEAFLAALRESGTVTEAARIVGANRNSAYAWTKKAGIPTTGRRGAKPHPGRGEYTRLRQAGTPRRHAAEQAGVHIRTAQDWDKGIRQVGHTRIYPDGYRVDYTTGMTTTGRPATISIAALDKHLHRRFLSLTERERIRDLLADGASLRAVGRDLGRPASTIMREIAANSAPDGTYRPYIAHRASAGRRPRPKDRKLLHGGPLRRFVEDGLAQRWSPQQIRNTLIKDHPDDKQMRVSVETIYQALYVQARGGLERQVAAALRSGRVRRKPRRYTDQRQPRFADPMIMISDRPAEIEDRAVPGHWEGDLICGAANKTAIVTLVERQTRYVMLGHLPGGHTAAEVRDVLVELIGTLPTHLRGSLTWDQGSEMGAHKSFSVTTGARSTSATPHHRGNEDRTRTPTAYCASTFPKELICPSTAQPTSNMSPNSSTVDHAKRSAGIPRPSAYVIY